MISHITVELLGHLWQISLP